MKDYAKLLETDLLNFNMIEKSLEIAEEVKKNNKEKILNITKAMDGLDEYERKVIKDLFINKGDIKEFAKEQGCTTRKIFLDKNKAIRKLTNIMYGI